MKPIDKLEDMLGVTLVSVETIGDAEVHFALEDGRTCKLFHEQDCCEEVRVEDICGELSDLVGMPLLLAEMVTSDTDPDGITPREYREDYFTWTFYKLATNWGAVTIRWYGESNGYYSEEVDFRCDEAEAAS